MSVEASLRNGLSPENELILCCVSARRFTEAGAARLRILLGRPLKWLDVVAKALDHHVETLVYESLASFGMDLVPAATLELLQFNVRRAGGLAILYFSELLRIQRIFDQAAVPLVPYKGPVLAWLAYQNLTRRRFVDLDFFVPHREIPRALELLVSSGLQAECGHQAIVTGRWWNVPGQFCFLHEPTRTHVELHTERTLRYFPVPLDFEKMRLRLIPIEAAGEKLRTFSIEDTLILLCVHGAKHFWDRIGWLVDVAELIRTRPIDWEKAMRIAAALKSTRLLLLGLHLTDELLDAPVPPAIIEHAQRDSSVLRLARKVQVDLSTKSNVQQGVLPRAVFRYRSRDGILDALRHGLRLAMSPTEGDRQALRLPRWLSPLYSLVRPFRLLREHGFGMKRQ